MKTGRACVEIQEEGHFCETVIVGKEFYLLRLNENDTAVFNHVTKQHIILTEDEFENILENLLKG